MPDVIVAQRMWQRRDNAANWASKNPVLEGGELGIEYSPDPSLPHKMKIGDGSTPWNSLPYFAGSTSGGGGGGVPLPPGTTLVAQLDFNEVDFPGYDGKGRYWTPTGDVTVVNTDPAYGGLNGHFYANGVLEYDDPSFALNNDPACLEMFIRMVDHPYAGYSRTIAQFGSESDSNNGLGWEVTNWGDTDVYNVFRSGYSNLQGYGPNLAGATYPLNWAHLCLMTTGDGVFWAYYNGVRGPNSLTINSAAKLKTLLRIGRAEHTWDHDDRVMLMGGFRYTKGTLLYNIAGGFTPPTSFNALDPAYVKDSPHDDKIYGRRNGEWVELLGVTAPDPVVYVTDSFDTDDLSSYTEYADSPANWSMTGGHLSMSSGGQSILTRNGISFLDGEVRAMVSSADDAGLALRLQDNSNYYLAVVADNSTSAGTPRVTIFKRISGSYTSIGSTAISFPRGTPKELVFSASGSTLSIKFDGATVLTVTDTAIGTAGKVGPRGHSTGSAANQFESFTWPT
jgi:hypothetical protein